MGNCDEVARGVLTLVKVPNSDVAELGDEDAPAVEFVIRVQFSYVLFSIVTREVSYSLVLSYFTLYIYRNIFIRLLASPKAKCRRTEMSAFSSTVAIAALSSSTLGICL